MSSEAERQLAAETLSALRDFARQHSEFMARIGGLIFNDTLEQWSGVFPDLGGGAGSASFITRSYGVAAGSLRYSGIPVVATATVTISSGGPSPSGVPNGTGCHKVLANQVVTVPLASREWTVYGAAGDVVNVAVFTKGVDPNS